MQRLSQMPFTKKKENKMLDDFEVGGENECFSPYRGTSDVIT